MPICFIAAGLRGKGEDKGRDKALSRAHGDGVWAPPLLKNDPDDALTHWREPPGYLGEAVRRAKRISGARQGQPPAPKNC